MIPSEEMILASSLQAGAVRQVGLHEVHASLGAVFEQVGDFLLPAHYGADAAAAVVIESTAARDAAALVDLSDRGLLAVTGPIRQKFLHNILSADVQSRSVGQGCLAALMDVKGHLLCLMRVLVAGDRVCLEMPANRLASVEAALIHYRVAAPVRFERVGDVVLGLLGPTAGASLGRAGFAGALPAEPEDHVTGSLAGLPVRLALASDLPAGGLVLHLSPEAAPTVWETLVRSGAKALGRRALDVLRVEDGRPWYGPDIDEHNLLHETGLLGLYRSTAKGCYVGQEVVARLDGRGGHVNKSLCGLQLGAPARAGEAVQHEGKDVGRVTTAALSPRLGPIALAYVHRSAVEPGTRVEVAGVAAVVEMLPLFALSPPGVPRKESL